MSFLVNWCQVSKKLDLSTIFWDTLSKLCEVISVCPCMLGITGQTQLYTWASPQELCGERCCCKCRQYGTKTRRRQMTKKHMVRNIWVQGFIQFENQVHKRSFQNIMWIYVNCLATITWYHVFFASEKSNCAQWVQTSPLSDTALTLTKGLLTTGSTHCYRADNNYCCVIFMFMWCDLLCETR